jgi:hypothetical protein
VTAEVVGASKATGLQLRAPEILGVEERVLAFVLIN